MELLSVIIHPYLQHVLIIVNEILEDTSKWKLVYSILVYTDRTQAGSVKW